MPRICIHAIVSGRVQGVFYRDTTCKKATTLSLVGTVKNLSDGTVEVVACGEKENVEALIKWLWEGPPLAKVNHVISNEIPFQEFSGFHMIR